MRSKLGLIVLMLMAAACAAPCQAAVVLAGYEAESSMCIRISETKADAVICMAGVTQSYAPKLKAIGQEVQDVVGIISK